MLSQEVGTYDELLRTLEITSALDVLALFNKEVNSGSVILHPWQIKKLQELSRPCSKDSPIRDATIAANGSGKSQFIVAPLAIFNCLCSREAEIVITTASGSQLDKQSGRFVKILAERINLFFREHFKITKDVFDIQVRKIENNFNGSFIDLFATDESGKAEGWHPLSATGRLIIIVDEAKTVDDIIFDALDRCKGYCLLLYISSPGGCTGRFYKVCTLKNTKFNVTKITAFENKHLSVEDITWQIQLHGQYDPLIRSSIFAEFTSVNDQVVIPREQYESSQKCFDPVRASRHKGKNRAGLDLSAGGDEQVLSIWNGLEQIKEFRWHIGYAPVLVDEVLGKLKENNVEAEDVWADDGGMGDIYLDMFQEKGWCFNRVLNQGRAIDNTRYANRGTELWFNLKRFIEENMILFLSDKNDTLVDQLTSRYYRINSLNKLILESKVEAKAKGHPSPDRADASVLAWAGLIYPLESTEKIVTNRVFRKPEEFEIWYNDRTRSGTLLEQKEELPNVRDGQYIIKDKFTLSQRKINEFVLTNSRNRLR